MGNKIVLSDQMKNLIDGDIKEPDKNKKTQKLAQHVRYFSEINEIRRAENEGENLKIFQIDNFITDILLGFTTVYLPPMKVGGKIIPNPFNAVMFNID